MEKVEMRAKRAATAARRTKKQPRNLESP